VTWLIAVGDERFLAWMQQGCSSQAGFSSFYPKLLAIRARSGKWQGSNMSARTKFLPYRHRFGHGQGNQLDDMHRIA